MLNLIRECLSKMIKWHLKSSLMITIIILTVITIIFVLDSEFKASTLLLILLTVLPSLLIAHLVIMRKWVNIQLLSNTNCNENNELISLKNCENIPEQDILLQKATDAIDLCYDQFLKAENNLAILKLLSDEGISTTKTLYTFINMIKDVETEQSLHINDLLDWNENLINEFKQLTEMIGKQALEVALTSTFVDSIVDSTEIASGHTDEVNEVVKSLSDSAVTSEQSISQMASAIGDLESTNKKVEELVNLIQDIATKTQVLAINAAIEASRAGGYGKGFSVIAQEIQKLSKNTTDVVKTIKQLHYSMNDKIRNGVALSSDVEESFREIITNTNKSNSLLIEISQALIEQKVSAKDILSKVDSILSITDMVNLKVVEQTSGSHATLELISMLRQINQSINNKFSYQMMDSMKIENILSDLEMSLNYNQIIYNNISENLNNYKRLSEKQTELSTVNDYEKRRAQRIKIKLPVRLFDENIEGAEFSFIPVYTDDISVSGLSCTLNKYIPPDTICPLTLLIPDEGSDGNITYKTFSCESRIVRIYPKDTKSMSMEYLIGIMFYNLNDQIKGELAKVINNYNSSEENEALTINL